MFGHVDSSNSVSTSNPPVLSPTNIFASSYISNVVDDGGDTRIYPPAENNVVSLVESARSDSITSKTVVVPVITKLPAGTVFSTINIGNVLPIDAPVKSIAL